MPPWNFGEAIGKRDRRITRSHGLPAEGQKGTHSRLEAASNCRRSPTFVFRVGADCQGLAQVLIENRVADVAQRRGGRRHIPPGVGRELGGEVEGGVVIADARACDPGWRMFRRGAAELGNMSD